MFVVLDVIILANPLKISEHIRANAKIMAGYGSISFVKTSGRKVEYEMNAIQAGQTNNYGVYFMQDIDGIWRIKFF